jgi:hypothetical protein
MGVKRRNPTLAYQNAGNNPLPATAGQRRL